MTRIYQVDPNENTLQGCEPIDFASAGVRERQDLEAWILAHPEILGEELLVVSSEYDRFEKSRRRLDVLAIDRQGKLVVIELKLDAARTYADQQAIRYAAFCSTMTMDDVVAAYEQYHGASSDESSSAIGEFLDCDELPELDDRPRIILAAGAFDDQELTATVLWLRSFGLDITCVELTPYRLTDGQTLVLVPKVLIPLPEAKEYIIQVENKQVKQRQRTEADEEKARLWAAIAREFNALDCQFTTRAPASGGNMQVRVGMGDTHYEWAFYRDYIAIALHFEAHDRDLNMRRLERIRAIQSDVGRDIEVDFVLRDFGKRWASAEFQLPRDRAKSLVDLAPEAARLMQSLIERTWLVVK